jgi:ribosomal protein S27AE
METMTFKKGYCPDCFGKILVNPNSKKHSCPHCGNTYYSEDAIHLYEEVQETNSSRTNNKKIKEKAEEYVRTVEENYDYDYEDDEESLLDRNVSLLSVFKVIGIILLAIFIVFGTLRIFKINDKEDLNDHTVRTETVSETIAQTEPETIAEAVSETTNETETSDNKISEEFYDADKIQETYESLILICIRIIKLIGIMLMITAIFKIVNAIHFEDYIEMHSGIVTMVSSVVLILGPTLVRAMIANMH